MLVGGAKPVWSGQAFGLSISSCFPLPGLRPDAGDLTGDRHCSLEIATHPDAVGGTRVSEWTDPAGDLIVSIDQFEGAYRFFAQGAGVYELSLDGRRITCEPHPDSGWIWRRYLLGQVLPFAALLQGLEVFHASAVELGGEALALVGPSGVGKSTLALNLHGAGAGFLSDDVLALELRGTDVVAYPGPAAAKVRQAAVGLVDAARLGPLVSSDTHERRYEIPTTAPVPLGQFCLLEPSENGELQVTDVAADPWRLLASTFNLVVATPERLRRQLEVCSAVARQARVCKVAVPGLPDAETAAALAAQLGSVPTSA